MLTAGHRLVEQMARHRMGERTSPGPGPTGGRRLLLAHGGAAAPVLLAGLSAAGLSVVGRPRDGHQAVAQALALRPDVVVIDAALPLLDGISATGSIVEQGAGPVVVVMSASETELMDQAVAAGATACLVEPLTPSSTVAGVELALAVRASNISMLAAARRVQRPADHGEQIEYATRLLVLHLRLTEASAVRWLHRTAREGRTTTTRVAAIVIDFWAHRPVNRRAAPPARVVPRSRAALYCC